MQEQFKLYQKNSRKSFLQKKKQEKQIIQRQLHKQKSIVRIQSHIRRILVHKKILSPFFKDIHQKLEIIKQKKIQTQQSKFSKMMSNAIYKMPYFFGIIFFIKSFNLINFKLYIATLCNVLIRNINKVQDLNQNSRRNICLNKILTLRGFQFLALIRLVRYAIEFLFKSEDKIQRIVFTQFLIDFFQQIKNLQNERKKIYEQIFKERKCSKKVYEIIKNAGQIRHDRKLSNILLPILIQNLFLFDFIPLQQRVFLFLDHSHLNQLHQTLILQNLQISNIYNLNKSFFPINTNIQFIEIVKNKYQFIVDVLGRINIKTNLNLFNVLLFIHNKIFNQYQNVIKKQIQQHVTDKFTSKIDLKQIMNSHPIFLNFLKEIPIKMYVNIFFQSFNMISNQFDFLLNTNYDLKIFKINTQVQNSVKNICYIFSKIIQLFSDHCFQTSNFMAITELSSKKIIINLYNILRKIDIKNTNLTSYKNTYVMNLIIIFILSMKQNLQNLDDIQFVNQSISFNKQIIYNTILIANRLTFQIILQNKQKQKYQLLLQNCKQLISDLYNKNFRTKFFDTKIFQGQNLTMQLLNLVFIQNHQRYIDQYMTYVPFSVSFQNRFIKMQQMIYVDRQAYGGYGGGNIIIRRQNQFQDAFNYIYKGNINLKKRFQVTFVNAQGIKEQGIDGGGLTKQFINRIVRVCFNPILGMFVQNSQKQMLPNSNFTQDLQFYQFVGSLVGKAIYQGIVIEPRFSGVFLNSMIGKKNGIQDLRYVDNDMYYSIMKLKHMQQNIQAAQLTFSLIQKKNNTQSIQIELKQNGRFIMVTNQNKEEFISKYVDYKVNKQFHRQNIMFRRGFNKIIKDQWLQMFNHDQIYKIISGSSNVFSIEDLKKYCVHQGYQKDDITIIHFWEILQTFTAQQKQSLLFFVTACSRPPTLGFKDLNPPFRIIKSEQKIHLPTAHTCVNTLRLPNYKNKNILKQKLLYAISSKVGFEFG